MTISIDDLVEKVKQANPIEVVIADDFSVEKRGRKLTTHEHDSLQIDVDQQCYYWWSKAEGGDVIRWIQNEKGLDFKGAVEYLCKRAKMPEPEWHHQDPTVRMTRRERSDTFSVAADLFHQWLLKDKASLDYCHGRGWTDETIELARLGFSGLQEDRPKLRKQMIDAFGLNGIDFRSPAAVAVIGFEGDIHQWGMEWNVEVKQEWVDKRKIYGAIGWGRLVYPHMMGGRCVYYATRSIDEPVEKRNPNKLLAGEKQVYANWVWSKSEKFCVVVEGQADAITLGQWNIPAIALGGVEANDQFGTLIGAKRENGRPIFYLGLDSDAAGSFNSFASNLDKEKKPTNTMDVGKLLGPMTYMLEWSKIGSDIVQDLDPNNEHDRIKDANDILKVSNLHKMNPDEVKKQVGYAINSCSLTFIAKFCELAGKEEGARADEAIKQAVEIISKMDDMNIARNQGDLARLLNVNQQELKRMIRAALNQEKKGEGGENVEYTMGGYIKGWLVEYMYDPEDGQPCLAWRDPSGNIGVGYSVVIEGKKYAAMPPTETIMKGGIQLASKLGTRKETKELANLIELFIKRIFLLVNPLFAKIISYYVLLTWVYDSFPAIPYLRATGEPGSGKSELMKRIGMICYRTISSNGASSMSSLFRMVEKYKGTVLMDEMDLKDSGASADVVKFLTEGSMEDGPIFRTEKVNIDGVEDFQETMFQTYCPKLICMQGDFFDKAVGTRCITFPVQPRESYELKEAGISPWRTKQMKAEALAIRNMLLHWRLVTWQSQREMNPDFINVNITARLNQITVPIQMIAENDEELRKEINTFMNEYHQYLIQDKMMSIEARIIEALWKIYKWPGYHKEMVEKDPDGREKIKVGNIKNVANDIMKEMNMDPEEDSDEEEVKSKKKKKKDAISAQMVGHRLREKLQFEITSRTSKGFYVIWDEKRMKATSNRYGVIPEDMEPKGQELITSEAPKAIETPVDVQKSLLEDGMDPDK